jgi:carboxylate-amine ligase
MLRAAHWRAARYGLGADLVDPIAETAIPAQAMVSKMLEYARPSLEECGDWGEVSALVRETLERGNGATLQREAYARAGRMEDVVDAVVAETARGTGGKDQNRGHRAG